MEDVDAAVVGSGPNGLSAAVHLARAGLRVRVFEAEDTLGGGTRTAERTLPGFLHDVCSAVHPMAVASPFFATLPLAAHGLEWVHPDVAVAHPLEDGEAVVLVRSLDETARGLDGDGKAYRRIVGPLAGHFDALAGDVLGPVLRRPTHPLLLARFGRHAALSATRFLHHAFGGERVRALMAGMSAHALLPLEAPFTASFGLLFAAAGHAVGWPVARGGSQRIADALAGILRGLGGEIVTGERITTLTPFESTRAVLFDTAPGALERIAGDRLPSAYRAKLRRFRHGPGVFKLDYALAGPMPWRASACRRAGTVHVGGTLDEIVRSEAEVARGRPPERPFVLVAQQSLFDPTRAPAGQHTLWAYCHVPNGSTFDMTARIEAQLERFAPGFRDLVLARAAMTPQDIALANENVVGGDIGGGANDGLQLFARPVLRPDPYATPTRALYLCSSSTPPGAGVHGMCGHHAARSALWRSFGLRDAPRSLGGERSSTQR